MTSITPIPPWEKNHTRPTFAAYLGWAKRQAAPGIVIDEELQWELYNFEFGKGEGDVIRGEEDPPSTIASLFGKTSLILQEKRRARRRAKR